MASTALNRYPSSSDRTVRRSTASDEIPSGQVSAQVDRIERRISTKDRSSTYSWTSSEHSQSLHNSHEPLTPPGPVSETLPNGASINGETSQTPVPDARSTTPLHQRSPPTPDQTPPKRRKHAHVLDLPAPPSITSHQTSSLTGSFMTAQEEFSTDNLVHVDEDELPTPLPATQATIGLGLGLETPEGHRTPTTSAPHIAGDSPYFPDTWNHADAIADDPFIASESIAVQDLEDVKHPLQRTRRTTEMDVADDFQASLERARGQLEDASISSMERDRSYERPDSQDSDFLYVDKKRLSDISSSSQVVQALVISTPRRKRQRLRHSSKNESLRTASSPLEGSNRSSFASSTERPRLHRVPHINWKRVSQNSDSGISMGSDQKQLPPPDLLGRMSSVKRSSAKERTLARRLSDLAREAEMARPVTAPETPAQKDPESERRSQSLQVREHNAGRGRRTIDYPPTIPPRASSLSAPTSQTNSRTTSLTNTTVIRRNVPAKLQVPPPIALGVQRSPKQGVQFSPLLPKPSRPNPEIVIDDVPDDGNDEPRSAYRRSALTTPFSGASLFSTSTPGPFEVDEATAIDIYPHNNTSVLVVQQRPAPGTEAANQSQASRSVRAKLVDLNSPVSDALRPFTPLQDPRPAPSPIEAAPAPVISIDPPESRLQRTPSGRILSVRRALAGRRRSESQIGPASRPLVDRHDISSKPGPKAAPFWRPWAFWTDVDPGSEPDDGDAYVSNSLGLPQRKFIPGPGSLSRRIGSLRRRKEQQAAEAKANQQIADVENRVGVLSSHSAGTGTGRTMPFATMSEAIEKLRHRRAEARSERNREQIRRRIGPVILPADARHF